MTSTDRVGIPSGRGRRSFRRRYLSTGVLWLVALGLGLLTIFPVFWMVSSSFKSRAEQYDFQLLPQDPTWDNYVHVFSSVPFGHYMLNSFFVSGTVTILALFFHSMAAYALARLRFPGRETIFLLIFSTLLVSLPVILVPLFILVREMGMIDTYAGLIIPAIFNAFGIFLLRQFYIGIPRELEEAAIIDGASYWKIYTNLIIPLSKPILSALAVFFFLANWNSFLWPLTITRDSDKWVVQIAISTFQQQYSSSQNYIMAASVVVALPTIFLFLFFQRQLVESIKTSGFK